MRDLTEDILSDKTERTYTTKHGTQAVMNTTNIGKSQPEWHTDAELKRPEMVITPQIWNNQG